jgi:hypothetical protein
MLNDTQLKKAMGDVVLTRIGLTSLSDADFAEVQALYRSLPSLRAAARELAALNAGGVDNWEWHGEAMQQLEAWDNEDFGDE